VTQDTLDNLLVRAQLIQIRRDARRTETHSKAQGGNATTISWSALSSADPMQVITKIVSLIDTVRYRNRPRRLVLYIYALWADSLKSNGHVNRCTSVEKGRALRRFRKPLPRQVEVGGSRPTKSSDPRKLARPLNTSVYRYLLWVGLWVGLSLCSVVRSFDHLFSYGRPPRPRNRARGS
jgi:hypothetical protein